MGRVMTIGTFDGLHAGHVELIETCAWMSDELVVGVNTDEFVRRYKGRAPTYALRERKRVVKSIKGVTEVVTNAQDKWGSVDLLLKLYSPRILAVGDDWAPLDRYLRQIKMAPERLAGLGVRVVFVPRTTGASSSQRFDGRQA